MTPITGDSALHMAATQGNAAIAGRLLGWGIKLELKNNAGDTALDIATRLGNAEMITLLSSSPAAGTQT